MMIIALLPWWVLYEDLSSEEGLDGRLEKLSAIYDIYGVDSDHMMEDW